MQLICEMPNCPEKLIGKVSICAKCRPRIPGGFLKRLNRLASDGKFNKEYKDIMAKAKEAIKTGSQLYWIKQKDWQAKADVTPGRMATYINRGFLPSKKINNPAQNRPMIVVPDGLYDQIPKWNALIRESKLACAARATAARRKQLAKQQVISILEAVEMKPEPLNIAPEIEVPRYLSEIKPEQEKRNVGIDAQAEVQALNWLVVYSVMVSIAFVGALIILWGGSQQ